MYVKGHDDSSMFILPSPTGNPNSVLVTIMGKNGDYEFLLNHENIATLMGDLTRYLGKIIKEALDSKSNLAENL